MKKFLKVAILSISLLTVMSGAGVSPALGNIREAFDDANLLLIKMILTIPAILIIPFSLLSGKLAVKMKKKTILILGVVVYLIGGIGGGIATNIYELLAFRALLGIGVGLIMPLSTGLIADFFEDQERVEMMGYSSAINQLGGMIAILLSGMLAAINWRLSFCVYALGFITLILVSFALPEPERKEATKKSKSTFNKELLKLMMAMMLVNIVFYTVPTNMAIFVNAEKLGDARMAGLALSIINVVAFVAGLFFSKIIQTLKRNTAIYGVGCIFIGYLIMSISNSIIPVMIAMVFIGAALGILLPLIFFTTSKSASTQDPTFALALVSSSMFLGQFLSPILVDTFGEIFGSPSIRFAFQFSAGISLISMMVIFFLMKKEKTPSLS